MVNWVSERIETRERAVVCDMRSWGNQKMRTKNKKRLECHVSYLMRNAGWSKEHRCLAQPYKQGIRIKAGIRDRFFHNRHACHVVHTFLYSFCMAAMSVD